MRHQPRYKPRGPTNGLAESKQKDLRVACDPSRNGSSSLYNEDETFGTRQCSLPFIFESQARTLSPDSNLCYDFEFKPPVERNADDGIHKTSQIAPNAKLLSDQEWVVIDPSARMPSLPLMPGKREDSDEFLMNDGIMPLATSTPEIAKRELQQLQDNSYQPGHRQSPGFPVPSNGLTRPTSRKKPLRKRSQLDKRPSDSEDTGADSSDENGVRTESSRGNNVFACPFYRLDPVRHRDCVNRRLMRIRDVKQHIQRRHTQATFYCPTCYLSFTSPDQRDRHIRSRRCERREPETSSRLDGISQKTQSLLKSRVDRGMSPPDQWYSIWNTIFKDAPSRPVNPYLGTVVEETVGMIRDFWRREAPQALPEFLQGQQMSDRSCIPVQVATNLVDEVLARFQQSHGHDGLSTNQTSPSTFSVSQSVGSPSALQAGSGGNFISPIFQSGMVASSTAPWNASSYGMELRFNGPEAHQLESPTENNNTSDMMVNALPYESYNDPSWIPGATSPNLLGHLGPFSDPTLSYMHSDAL